MDKTIAEYDTNELLTTANGTATNMGKQDDLNGVLLASKTKLLANDANAASIRTRFVYFSIFIKLTDFPNTSEKLKYLSFNA